MRHAYFVVALNHAGREAPAVYRDELPRGGIRHRRYVVRLDLMPGAEALCATPLDRLFAIYLRLKRIGKLPPQWEG